MTSALASEETAGGFNVHLTNFSGPFDLLLQLIGKHKLDITEVALSQVTDEFIAHLRHAQDTQAWDLNETSQFIVIAATLVAYALCYSIGLVLRMRALGGNPPRD